MYCIPQKNAPLPGSPKKPPFSRREVLRRYVSPIEERSPLNIPRVEREFYSVALRRFFFRLKEKIPQAKKGRPSGNKTEKLTKDPKIFLWLKDPKISQKSLFSCFLYLRSLIGVKSAYKAILSIKGSSRLFIRAGRIFFRA